MPCNIENETAYAIQEYRKDHKLKGLAALRAKRITQERIQEFENMRNLHPKVLPEKMITYFVGDSGIGKTNIAMALINEVLSRSEKEVFYIDFDNIPSYVKQQINYFDTKYERFNYLFGGDFSMSEILKILEDMTMEECSNLVIFIDPFQTLVQGETSSGKDVKPIIELFIALRNAGATIAVIHHTIKSRDERGRPKYDGHHSIKDKADNMFMVEREEESNVVYMTQIKRRANVENCAFRLDFGDIEAEEVEYRSHQEREKEIKTKNLEFDLNYIRGTIFDNQKNGRDLDLTKTTLVALIRSELSITERIARKLCEKYENVFWTFTIKDRNAHFVTAIRDRRNEI